jgi:LysM repeat protein
MREDLRGLTQRVGELSLRVEQLERENRELRQQVSGAARGTVTSDQLDDAVEGLRRSVRAEIKESSTQTLQQVGIQMEKLAKQTNAVLDSMSRTQPAKAGGQGGFSEDYAKEGVSYTVQKGDTIALIAKKTGARVSDIINANKIADPSRIVPGQTLFIPNPPSGAAAK